MIDALLELTCGFELSAREHLSTKRILVEWPSKNRLVDTLERCKREDFGQELKADGCVVELSAEPLHGGAEDVGVVESECLGGERAFALDLHGTTGLALDGNGNGLPGDDYTANFHRLYGDADGDADVDITDFVAFRAAFGNGPSIFDNDNDGDTDNADFVAFRGRFGTTLP